MSAEDQILERPDGAQIAYLEQGSGVPVVFVHAGIADSRMWRPQLAALGNNFRLVRYDWRGAGRTRVPPQPFRHTDDLLALFEHLGIARAHLVGASYGGKIAIDFALALPDRVASLMLAAPAVSGSQPSAAVREYWQQEEELLANGATDAAVELNVRFWVDGPLRTPEQVSPELRAQVAEMQRDAFAVTWPEGAVEIQADQPAIGRLAELRAPTHVVVGQLDRPEKVVQAAEIAATIPGAALTYIEEAGHLPTLERPAVFNQLLRDWLTATS